MGEGDMGHQENVKCINDLRCEYSKLLEDSVNPRLFRLLNNRIQMMNIDDLKYRIGRLNGVIT